MDAIKEENQKKLIDHLEWLSQYSKRIDEAYLPPREECFPKGISLEYFEGFQENVYLRLNLNSSYISKCRCPECGGNNLHVRGTQERYVKDIPYQGREFTWTLTVQELECECTRKSFVPSFPGFLERGAAMTVRMKEFILFLAVCTSGESAARILRAMYTKISGDTIRRVMKKYLDDTNSAVRERALIFAESASGTVKEDEALDIAQRLGYFMTWDILSLNQNKRLDAMWELFHTVFVEKKKI